MRPIRWVEWWPAVGRARSRCERATGRRPGEWGAAWRCLVRLETGLSSWYDSGAIVQLQNLRVEIKHAGFSCGLAGDEHGLGESDGASVGFDVDRVMRSAYTAGALELTARL